MFFAHMGPFLPCRLPNMLIPFVTMPSRFGPDALTSLTPILSLNNSTSQSQSLHTNNRVPKLPQRPESLSVTATWTLHSVWTLG